MVLLFQQNFAVIEGYGTNFYNLFNQLYKPGQLRLQ